MYKICLYNVKTFHDQKTELEFIYHTPIESDIGQNLNIGGQDYEVCVIDLKNKICGVRPINFVDDPEEIYDDNFICPFCEYVDDDAFELADEGETECPSCSSKIKYAREVSVNYTTIPVKKNKPIAI